MKKLLPILLVFFVYNLSAQESKIDSTLGWNINGDGALQFNNAIFSNWSKGGENSIAGSIVSNILANYKGSDFTFENSFAFGYGLIYSDEYNTRKTDDKLDFNSKFGLNLTDELNASVLLNFNTQFAVGYKYPNDSTVISNFMAPGYLNLSAGLDYKPGNDLSIFLTPVSGRITFVMDQSLADVGQYGVKAKVEDTDGNIISKGENIKMEFGANLVVNYKKEIFENVTAQTKYEMFMNYTDENVKNRTNIDVNWETIFNLKINSWLNVNLFFHLLYDNDILVPIKDANNPDRKGRRLQFKNTNGLAISFKF